MIRFTVCGILAASALFLITGCPSNPDANGNTNANGNDNSGGFTGTSQLAGTFSGSLSCSRSQTVTGANPGQPVTSTRQLSIQFGSDGRPASVTVISFSGATDQVAAVSDVGDTVTLNFSDSTGPVTEVVTVTDATITETSTSLTLRIEYSSTSGQLTRTGTGTQTIEATLAGSALTYSAEVDYEIDLVAGAINLPTTETTTCTGSLTKQ